MNNSGLVFDKIEEGLMKKNIRVVPNSIFLKDNKMVCSERYSTCVFEYNIQSEETKSIGVFPDGLDNNTALFYRTVRVKNLLFYIPFNATSICILNIDSYRMESISLPEDCRKSMCKFYSASYCEGKLYFWGYGIPICLSYSLSDGVFSVEENISYSIRRELGEDKEWLFYDSLTIGKKIFAVSARIGGIVCFDTNDNSCEIIVTNSEKKGYSSLAKYNNKIILTPYFGNDFVEYDYENGRMEFKKNESEEECSYLSSLVLKESYFAFPFNAEYMVEINLDTGFVQNIDIGCKNANDAIFECAYSNGQIFLNKCYKGEILVFNVIDNTTTTKQLSINDENLGLYHGGLYNENCRFGLDRFVERI